MEGTEPAKTLQKKALETASHHWVSRWGDSGHGGELILLTAQCQENPFATYPTPAYQCFELRSPLGRGDEVDLAF